MKTSLERCEYDFEYDSHLDGAKEKSQWKLQCSMFCA